MAHDSIVKLAQALKEKRPCNDIKGLAYISKEKEGMELPSFESVKKDKEAYIKSFHLFYGNNDHLTAKKICQKLEVGTASINTHGSGPPGVPWGGAKESGLGRMDTKEGMREFTNIKYVQMT